MKKFFSLVPFLIILLLVSCMSTKGSMDDKIMEETAMYEGYLIDVWCGDSQKGMDGSDVVNDPAGHSTKCLIMCEEGGYGISVKDGDQYTFIAFADEQSNEKAKDLIANTTREKGNKVSVEGYMVDDKLCVVSIIEID